MPKLPGLDRLDDDTAKSRSTPRAVRGRVVTDNRLRQAPSLNPVASPVDTYARPAQAPADNTLSDLAKSLASLNPSLMNFADVNKTVSDETLPARITQRYAGKSPEEQAAMMENDPDAKSILGQRAIAANAGRAMAQKLGQEAAKFYETQFDKDNGDLDGYLNGQMRKAIEANPNNPFFAEQFAEVFGPISNSIRAQQTEYLTNRTNTAKAETIQGSWLGTVNKGILEERPAADIAKEIAGAYETNRKGLNLSYEDQDKAQVGVIQQLMLQMDQEPGNAEKLYGVIQALAVNPRTTADGAKQGRLLDSITWGPDVAKLLTAAEDKVTEQRKRTNLRTTDGFRQQAENGNLDEDALDAFAADPKTAKLMPPEAQAGLLAMDRSAKEQAAAGLVRQQAKQAERDELDAVDADALTAGDNGYLAVLRDRTVVTADGGTRVISIEDQRKAAARAFMEREDRRVSGDPRGPEAARPDSFLRQLRWFSMNGQKQEQWANTLRAGVAGMSSVQEKGITEATRHGFNLYRQLSAKAPNYLGSLLTSEEAQVYDVASAIVDTGEKTEDEALIAAQRFYSDPARSSSITAGLGSKEVYEALTKHNGSGWFSSGWENPEIMSGEVQKLAKAMVVAGGLSPDDAIEKAAESVSKGYTMVNGWAVKTFSRQIPQDFADKAERFLTEFVAEHGEANGVDMGELTIQAIPGTANMWRVVSKETGLPVIMDAESRGSGLLTTDILRLYAEEDRAKAETALIARQAERMKWGPRVVGGTGKPIVPFGGPILRQRKRGDKDVRVGPVKFDIPEWLNPKPGTAAERVRKASEGETLRPTLRRKGEAGKPLIDFTRKQ